MQHAASVNVNCVHLYRFDEEALKAEFRLVNVKTSSPSFRQKFSGWCFLSCDSAEEENK